MSQATNTGPLKAGPRQDVLRSQLGRARGLGSARGGTAVWVVERVTSIALVPLTLWFVYAALHLAGLPRAGVATFVGNPLNAALMLALVLLTFHHTQLGLQVVVEDYVHAERVKMPLLLAIKGVAFFLTLACGIAVLKLALSG